jgi:hypothetical protein
MSEPVSMRCFITLDQFLRFSSQSEKQTLTRTTRLFRLQCGKLVFPLCQYVADCDAHGIVFVVEDTQPIAECYSDIVKEYVLM